MDGFENILESVGKVPRESRNIYLGVLNETQSFRGNKNVASNSISSMLSKNSSRATGLRFFIPFLRQCSVEVVEKKANLWMTLVMKACNKKEISFYGDLIYEALGQLVENVQLTPDHAKTFGTTHITKFFDSLCLIDTKINQRCVVAALRTIKKCLKLYPGPSKSGKATVIKFLVRLVDSSNNEVVSQSGECWLLLQQVRGGNVNVGMSNDKAQWREFQLNLIGSLHLLLNEAFANCNDPYDGPVVSQNAEVFTLTVEGDPINRAAQISKRFCNLVEYLKITLGKPFPAKKSIYTKKVLNIIQRGLGVTCASLSRHSNIDNVCIGTLLPEMQTKLLELLETLINTCGTHIRIHFRVILGLLLDSLRSTRVAEINFVAMRSMVYKLTGLWCTTLKSGSHIELVFEHLVQEILKDITLQKSQILLVALSKQLKTVENKLSKMQPSTANSESSEKGNQILCQYALTCLQESFFASGHCLKPSIIENVIEHILIICAQFYELPLKDGNHYKNWECRMEIYKTISAIITYSNHRIAPPTEMILHILRVASHCDNSIHIRKKCQSIIQDVEKTLHPSKPSLLFPSDPQITNPITNFIESEEPRENQSSMIQNSPPELPESQIFDSTMESSNEVETYLPTLDNELVVANPNSTPEHVISEAKHVESEAESVDENHIESPLPTPSGVNIPVEMNLTQNITSNVAKKVENGFLEHEPISLNLTNSPKINSTSSSESKVITDEAISVDLNAKPIPMQIDENNSVEPNNDNEFIAQLEAAFIDELKY